MRAISLWFALTVVCGVVAPAWAQPAGTTGTGETATAEPAAPEVPATGEAATAPVEIVNPFAPAPEQPASPGPSGEDEGGPVPSAPPNPELDSAQVESVPVAPSEATDEGAAEDEEGWLDRLDHVTEDAPLLQLRTGPLVVAPVGMVQFLAVPWQGEGARLANGGYVDEAGFRFRRVRIGFQGWGPWHIRFNSLSEFDEQGAELLDLSLTFAPFEALEIGGGASKAPFSGSMLTPAMFQTFLDRPWGVDGVTGDGERMGIAPGRMLGVWLGGRWSVLRWQAGVYNGNTDYFIGNDNNGMLYGARLECLPLGDLPDGQLIVAAGEPRLRIGAAYYFNDDAAGDTHGVEADVKFRWKGLTAEGEFLWSTFALAADPTRPPDMAADIERWAYYGQVGYLVWEPWLDIAARFDAFLLDDGVDDFNDRWTVAGVATFFVLRNRVKLQLEYAHHQEMADPQISNDSVALQLQGRF
jgi:hypothetical protein